MESDGLPMFNFRRLKVRYEYCTEIIRGSLRGRCHDHVATFMKRLVSNGGEPRL